MTETLTGHALSDMLASWLPRQRWFPGSGSSAGELEIISDEILLDGDPQLRHLIVEAGQVGMQARFQVLLGCRSQLPATVAGTAVIGQLPGMTCYDALHDPDLAMVLLRGIAHERTAGPLRFVREPAAPLHDWQSSRLLTAEQSNTSLVFGEAAILKVLRRLFPGANPDLEVADALARLGSDRVAAPFGWIETRIGTEPVLLGVLSEFLAHASDGWKLATQTLGRLYARQGAYGQEYLTAPVPTGEAGPATDSGLATDAGPATDAGAGGAGGLPFTAEARELGTATAQMHVDMATAFGRRAMTTDELAALAATLTAKLNQATSVVPELAGHAGRIRAAYDEVARIRQPVMMQRIHGDYHLGQVHAQQARLGGARLRGRARGTAGRAPGAGAPAAGRRRHAEILRLRGPASASRSPGAAEPRRDGDRLGDPLRAGILRGLRGGRRGRPE